MSITSIQDVRLNVKPIYIDMSHLYVDEGPCRFGRGEELTYELDKAMNAEINKSSEINYITNSTLKFHTYL